MPKITFSLSSLKPYRPLKVSAQRTNTAVPSAVRSIPSRGRRELKLAFMRPGAILIVFDGCSISRKIGSIDANAGINTALAWAMTFQGDITLFCFEFSAFDTSKKVWTPNKGGYSGIMKIMLRMTPAP